VTGRCRTNRLLFFALTLVCTATAGLADPIPASPELVNYANRPAHIRAVLDVIRAQAAEIPMCHPATAKSSVLTAPGPVLFGDNGQPSGGRWTETWTVNGCSQSGVFNVMTFVDKTGQVRTVGLLPGTTRADPLLQKDASEQAYPAAMGRAPAECKPQLWRIIDTAFIEFSGAPAVDVPPGRDPRPWRENWTLLACNVRIIVPMHFIPDATGTKIIWIGAEIRVK
jgi:hypothetical protein